jgi:hypothetical protein
MKKISLLALAFCTSMALFAQDQPTLKTEMAVKPYFGIKAGVNLAKLRATNLGGNFNSKTSLQGGFVANIPLGGMLSFQPELLYLSSGGKNSNTLLGQTITTEQDLHYISLPLMLQVKPGGSGFFVEVGPQASYLIRATNEVNNTETNNKDEFDKFDVAVNGGLGFITRVGLGLNARYSYGLSNILEDNGTDTDTKLKNSGIQIGLVYLFGANK